MWTALLSLGPTLLARRGMVLGVLVAVLVGALGVMTWGAVKYNTGKRDGVTQDRQRSDKVIAQMIEEARQRVIEADAKTAAKEAAWEAQLKEAQRASDEQRKTLEARLAAERAGAGKLRDQLAAAAAGGVPPGQDTVEACRERTAAFGDVLGEILPALAECTGAAEDHARGVRTLLGAWPEP